MNAVPNSPETAQVQVNANLKSQETAHTSDKLRFSYLRKLLGNYKRRAS